MFFNFIIDSSRKTNLLELVNKKLSQKAVHLLNKKSEPFFPFREEFKFDFPDQSSTSSKHPFQTIRVKRDVSGVLSAKEINAQNIETNQMFAKYVTADILKAERVNAIVISIGRAFSITKATSPTGAPDTLVLNRNGPDPTDTGVTIVLERGNAPVSFNGHPIHEEEKRKLLDLKNSFVKPISRRRKGGRMSKTTNNHWRHTNGDLFKMQDNSRYRRPVNNQTSRRRIQSQRTKNTTWKLKSNRQSRFQKLLPRQIRRKTQSTIITNTIRKLKPRRNQTQKLQRRKTVYGRPNKYTSNHTTNFSSGKRITLTPLQRKRLILNHWRKKMTAYEKRKALYAKRGSGKFKKWTRPYHHQLQQTVQPPITKNLKPDMTDVQRTDPVTPSPIPQPSVYTGSKHKVILPFKSFVHKKVATPDQDLGPVISKVQKNIHKNAKKAIGFKTSKESDYYASSSFETEYDSSKEEYKEFDIEVPLKEFDRRNDWFNQDNHDFYYDDDETEDGHFDESSDEIETYEGNDKEEHMFPGRDGRIILKGSDVDGNFLISKYTVNTDRSKTNDTSPFSGESYEYEFYSDESSKREAEPKRLTSTSNNTNNKQMSIFKIGSNKEESMKMGIFSDYNYDSDYYSSDNIDSQDLYRANHREKPESVQDLQSKKTKKNNRRRNPDYFTDYSDSSEEEKLTYVKTKNRNVVKNSGRQDSFFSDSAVDFFNDQDQSDYTDDFYSSVETTDDTSKYTTKSHW